MLLRDNPNVCRPVDGYETLTLPRSIGQVLHRFDAEIRDADHRERQIAGCVEKKSPLPGKGRQRSQQVFHEKGTP